MAAIGHNPNDDGECPNPPKDTIQSLAFGPTHNYLVSGSWDKTVCLWDIQSQAAGTAAAPDKLAFRAIPQASISHDAPVLSVAFAGDGSRVFSGSCDTTIKMWNLATNTSEVIGKHDAPVRSVHWVKDMNVLMTGSWDKTLRYWDLRTPNPVMKVTCAERIYCCDVGNPIAVAGLADRTVAVYDLRNPSVVAKSITSPLRFQTRCVSLFPNLQGFAIGSIEGRVGIHHLDESQAANNFAFKCHRDNNDIHAVNAISFHPRYGTFSTAGADKCFNFWDKDSKQRLVAFKPACNAVTSTAFNQDGTIFAYAVGYDWSKGSTGLTSDAHTHIFLHSATDSEIKSRPKAPGAPAGRRR